MIAAERLSVHYRRGIARRSLKALDNLDLSVGEGDFFALLGANGAGKSTAIYSFLGLIKPTSGSVRILGRAPTPGAALYAGVGYLPEEPHYHDYLSIEEAVAYYGALTRSRSWRGRADALLERLGLTEFRKLRLGRCSKGMKQKLGIVQCLLGDPRLLLLDEPMRGLDPLAVREVRDILLELNHRGVTILMNSHILSEVELVANRVAILDAGRVVATGRLSELIATDPDSYLVEIERCEGLPDYFTVGAETASSVEGTIPADRFHDFIDLARDRRLRVLQCALRKSTLEDAYLRILKRPRANA
jgi:ABC-2 type transport system ATP-binding protein